MNKESDFALHSQWVGYIPIVLEQIARGLVGFRCT